MRGLTPLVAPLSRIVPARRAGVATLLASAGWRVRPRARTLGTALDNVGEFLPEAGGRVNAKLRVVTMNTVGLPSSLRPVTSSALPQA